MALSLTLGQRADITEAEPLLNKIDPKAFIADKAYDANLLVEKLKERQITPVIPSRKSRRHTEKSISSSTKKETKSNGSSPD